MVVFAASVINQSGKVLVSRQFVNMSCTLIQTYLEAFPTLLGTCRQQHHTFVESQSVRYVYQPLDSLYLILLTDKQSNIFQDLDTLSLLSKLVASFASSLDEEGVALAAFDLIFAFDQVISLGHKEDVTFTQVLQSFDMQSDQERLYNMAMQTKIDKTKDVMKRKAAEIGKAPPLGLGMQRREPLTDPVTLIIEEKLNITLKRDGGIGNFDIQGSLSLHMLNQDGLIQIQLQIDDDDAARIQYETQPGINAELFRCKNILGCKDTAMPFPTGSDGISLLKWRMQIANESWLPFLLTCCPHVLGNETFVNLEYKALKGLELRNVLISIPLTTLSNVPTINHVDGEWRYDSGKSILEWSISFINEKNCSGMMAFVIPTFDTLQLYPISVQFTCKCHLADLEVFKVLPLRGGNPPKFSQRSYMSTGTYQLV